MLGNLDWFGKDVAELAIKRVHSIVQKIGYPDTSPDVTSPESLRAYYSGVDILPSTFFENSISARKGDTLKAWKKLTKPSDPGNWGMTPPTVNAYCNPPQSEIVFPAGILQFPIFGINVPEYINYGAFGSVAGHELSHAFDSNGRHYDITGNMTDWWPEETVEEFEKRASCFVDQFSEYYIEGYEGEKLYVDGELTLGENIADAGGIIAAFEAWKKRDIENPGKRLPGLEKFSKEQMFFVAFTRTWCSKSKSHPPPKFL